MPYLRFSRDTRGYEHTYVLHGLRTGSRPHLLYWFRTPPNISVGRLPLDEEAIRAIEACNPEVTFDWTKMTATSRTRPRPAAEREREAATVGRSGRSRRTKAPAPARTPDSGAVAEPVEADAPTPDDPAVPADLLEVMDEPIEDAAPDPERRHPVAALLGDGALTRMRARYAELRARLAESDVDGDARTSLAARVEDLNPDGWRAGEAVVLGVERFDSGAAAIRVALGRRRHPPPRAEPQSV